MFYNKVATDFVRETLSSRFNIYFSRMVKEYLNGWRFAEREKDKCTFCSFVLQCENPETTKQTIEEIKEFATRMPISCTGVVFVWYYVVRKFELTISKANDIDPNSIFYHLILKTCSNDANISALLGKCVPKILELQTDIREEQSQSADDEEETKVEEESTSTIKQSAKQLRVNYELMMENLKRGGCYGYNKEKNSRCIYSNTGCYDTAAVNHSLNVDARFLVSPNWVVKHLPNVSLDEYYEEKNYIVYQPSIRQRVVGGDLEQELKDIADKSISLVPTAKKAKVDKKTSRITSLFTVEGELTYGRYVSGVQRNDIKNKIFSDRYLEIANAVTTEINVLYELHHSCYNPEIRGTRELRLGIQPKPCLWCTLCISPNIRRVIYDLMSMARDQLRVLGMKHEEVMGGLMTGDDALTSKFYYGTANECEEEATKNAVTDHERRRKGRRGIPSAKTTASRHPDVLYSLDFEGCRIQCEPITTVFREWAEEKYPFMHNFFASKNLYAKNDIEDDVRKHCTSDGNVFCICNMRRLFSDTDCYMRRNHVCLLPFLFQSANNVVQLLGEEKCLKILKGRINCLTARHHMSPRIG